MDGASTRALATVLNVAQLQPNILEEMMLDLERKAMVAEDFAVQGMTGRVNHNLNLEQDPMNWTWGSYVNNREEALVEAREELEYEQDNSKATLTELWEEQDLHEATQVQLQQEQEALMAKRVEHLAEMNAHITTHRRLNNALKQCLDLQAEARRVRQRTE